MIDVQALAQELQRIGAMNTSDATTMAERLMPFVTGKAKAAPGNLEASELNQSLVDNLQSQVTNLEGLLDLCGAEPGEAEVPDLHDFLTHRRSWRSGLEHAKRAAEDRGEGASYWSHEIRAFDRAFDLIKPLAEASEASIKRRADGISPKA